MRQEFTPKTKLAAWQREDGRCQSCGKKIRPGDGPHYDHAVPAALGGTNDIDNCRVLCIACHGGKTAKKDRPAIAKSKRYAKKAAKADRPKRRGFYRPPGAKYDWDRGRYVR